MVMESLGDGNFRMNFNRSGRNCQQIVLHPKVSNHNIPTNVEGAIYIFCVVNFSSNTL